MRILMNQIQMSHVIRKPALRVCDQIRQTDLLRYRDYLVFEILDRASIGIIYWKTSKMQHLIQCQFHPEDQVTPVSRNEMDTSDQLACIWYKNQNVVA